jgi:hypothetical protein
VDFAPARRVALLHRFLAAGSDADRLNKGPAALEIVDYGGADV